MNAVSLAGTGRTREGAGRTSGVGQADIAPITLILRHRPPRSLDATAHISSRLGRRPRPPGSAESYAGTLRPSTPHVAG